MKDQKKHNWSKEALESAAQCWCDLETSAKTMDVVLAKAVAKRIEQWMDTATQYAKDSDYYRELLERCGEAIGDRAYTADDGTRTENVLCEAIPEIIENDYSNSA